MVKHKNSSSDSDTIELFSRDEHPISHTSNISLNQKTSRRTPLLMLSFFLLFLVISFVIILRITPEISSKRSSAEEPLLANEDEDDLVFNYHRQDNERIKSSPKCSSIEPNSRFDCHPDQPISEQQCLKRSCCFSNDNITSVPNCFFGEDFVGYLVKTVEEYPLKTLVTLERQLSSGFARDSQTVKVEVISLDETSLRSETYYI